MAGNLKMSVGGFTSRTCSSFFISPSSSTWFLSRSASRILSMRFGWSDRYALYFGRRSDNSLDVITPSPSRSPMSHAHYTRETQRRQKENKLKAARHVHKHKSQLPARGRGSHFFWHFTDSQACTNSKIEWTQPSANPSTYQEVDGQRVFFERVQLPQHHSELFFIQNMVLVVVSHTYIND